MALETEAPSLSAAKDLAALKIDRSGRRRRVPSWPFIALGAILIAFVGLPALQQQMRGAEVVTAQVVKVLMLKQLADGNGQDQELTAAGYIVADRKAVLAAKFVGRLAKLNVKEAQEVKAGEIVAEVEHHELDAQIEELKAEIENRRAEVKRLGTAHEQALAEVESARIVLATFDAEVAEMKVQWDDARRRLERDRKLAEAQAMGFSEVDDRETEVKLAEARMRTIARRREASEQLVAVRRKQAEVAQRAIEVAEAGVATTRARLNVLEAQRVEYFIRAPFDGVVTEKAAEQGEIIAPVSVGGQLARGSIVTVADWASLQAEVDVAETYLGRVKPGQRAAITVDAMPGKTFAGRLQRILPRADRGKATVQVRVEFLPNADGRNVFAAERLLPDMGIRAKFLPDDAPPGADTGEAPPVLAAPKTALRDGGFVWVVKDDTALRRAVKAGAAAGDWVEILEGLDVGEAVVVSGAEKLKADGAKVVVLEK
ncbi:MAG: efflux RND transporter periplasmic adaptor subunit [Planctomycetota bacterium]|nr:efflux RND transporter periplasmic adaptor subunit [Planctomycetota bacterium]